ncbi:hypothetical protein [Blautia marasmi]|uniref:hypothetical protein n=1 Tax=Blautia marasmi TaxID=1917868 RepID=UPI000CF2C480|nr:hypothetical protein [Blautia marasmi]
MNNIFDEDNLELNVKFASLFVLNFECLKDFVVNKIRDFYSDNIIEDGKWIHKETKKYKEVVRALSRYIDDASMKWFIDSGAITEADYELYQTIRTRRNDIIHELLKNSGDGFNEIDIELFGSLLSLYRKLDKWWINEIEISISAEDIPKDYDPDEVVGGQAIVLFVINDILLGNQGERYKEILTNYNEK